jgi:hypothetical protein
LTLTDVDPSERLVHLFPIVPSLTPINTAPDHVAEAGTNPAGVFAGDALGRGSGSHMGHDFFVPSSASQRVYDVLYLRDATRPGVGRQAISFMGDDRFGVAPYTAELEISVIGKRPIWVAGEFVGGFFVAEDKGPFNRMLDAVVAAKSARDRVMVNPTTYRPLTVGTPLYLGTEIVLGAFTRS